MARDVSDERLDRMIGGALSDWHHEIVAAARPVHLAVARTHGASTVELRPRWLLLALIALAAALFLALSVGVGQQPSPPLTFAPGSLAFARDDGVYVAGPDGVVASRLMGGQKLAFSPDRRYLAVASSRDPVTGTESVRIVAADGSIVGSYVAGTPPDSTSGAVFGWAPDGERLAMYPGSSPNQVALIGRDGTSLGSLALPAGASLSTKGWFEFGSPAWSPDGTWVAVAVRDGGRLSHCAVSSWEETCYILLATDGSGAQGLSDESSGYLAWAPDGRVALTHWAARTVDIWPADRTDPHVIVLPDGWQPSDGRVLAWSPDGGRLAVAVRRVGQLVAELLVIDAGGMVEPVPMDPFDSIDTVAWSGDGQLLLFQGYGGDPATQGIWSIDVSGGGSPTLVAESTGSIFEVAGGVP